MRTYDDGSTGTRGTVYVCSDCGGLVLDREKHDVWHDFVEDVERS